MTKCFPWLLLLTLFSSCEKAITLIPGHAEPLLVVEAVIENDNAPVVILSRSLNYFDRISAEEAAASFVHDAVVRISNGARTHTLREYAVDLPDGIQFYYYSNDSANLPSSFKGQLGRQYTLRISADGKEYSAAATIPRLDKKIESLYWDPVSESGDSTSVILSAQITDPPGYGNYVRYFTKRNGEDYLPPFNSVYDDQLIDGKTYLAEIERGMRRNMGITGKDTYFQRGDKITVKFCNIEKQAFDFWRTMEYNYASIGNPFSSPGKVLGNIQGGALGYFGGYAAQYISLNIPE